MNRRTSYKLELIYIKYIPMIMSAGILVNVILNYWDIYLNTFFGYFLGTSMCTVLHLYVSSYSYKFCRYHRMFIHYIVISNILLFLDYNVTIPISDRSLFLLHIFIAGIFLFLILYIRQKSKRQC